MVSGRIYFAPDPARGNDGPQGYAPIENGRYYTAKGGEPAAGGPVVVRIDGYYPPTADYPHGKPLFIEYKVLAAAPGEAATHASTCRPRPDPAANAGSRRPGRDLIAVLLLVATTARLDDGEARHVSRTRPGSRCRTDWSSRSGPTRRSGIRSSCTCTGPASAGRTTAAPGTPPRCRSRRRFEKSTRAS